MAPVASTTMSSPDMFLTTTNDNASDVCDVVVVGHCNTDLSFYADRFPRPGETMLGTSFRQGFGGKAANQAVMCGKTLETLPLVQDSALEQTIGVPSLLCCGEEETTCCVGSAGTRGAVRVCLGRGLCPSELWGTACGQ